MKGNDAQERVFADDELSAERAYRVIDLAVAALEDLESSGALTRSSACSARVFPLAFGWFTATVRHAQLVALAHRNGLRHESSATSRVVMQHALALQWLIEGGDAAVDAVEADGRRRVASLYKELDDTGWPKPAGLIDPALSPPPKSGALEQQLVNFKDMCTLYMGGNQLYVPYRLQSGNAHPSYAGAAAYLNQATGQVSATAVTDTYGYLLDSARCLIQALKTFAPLVAGSILADVANEVDAAFGVEIELWTRIAAMPAAARVPPGS